MLLRDNKLNQALVNGTQKFAIMAALLLTTFIGTSFATPVGSDTPAGTGNEIVIASFRKEFRTADVMQVENKRAFTKVTFKLNGVVMFAYYSGDGDLLAVIRNILSTQLPIQLLMELKQNHSDCWITDLFEIDSNGQTVYFVSLENADTKMTLRSGNTTTWETYQKENKEANNL